MLKFLIKFISCTLIILQVCQLFAAETVTITKEQYFSTNLHDYNPYINKVKKSCENYNKLGKEIPVSQKNECVNIMKMEENILSEYKSYIDTCIQKQAVNLSKEKPELSKKVFLDFLTKEGKLSLLKSKDPIDIKQLKSLEEALMFSIAEKLFGEKCKSINLDSFRGIYLGWNKLKFHAKNNVENK